MTKRKKKKVEAKIPVVEKPTETRYYWCVNCGHHGDYGSIRKRGLRCELCDYDDVCPYTEKEIESDSFHWGLDTFKTKKQVEKKEKNPHRGSSFDSFLKEEKIEINEKSVAEKLAEIRNL